MKKGVWAIIILVLVLIIVFGILRGRFRRKESLSQEELLEIDKIKSTIPPSNVPSNNIQTTFQKLWLDHVERTRQFILAEFHNLPDLQQKENSLMQNQEDIANEIDKYYPNSKTILTNLLKEHIAIAKDIVEDLKYRRLNRVPSDINRWYNNADQFSEAMERINPNWKLKKHFYEHLALTESEVLAEWVGLKKSSLNIYNNKIVPNSQKMANDIIQGIK